MKKHSRSLRLSTFVAGLLAVANLGLADNEVWIGNPGVTATTNWSDTANWSGTAQNPNDNNVYFGSANAVAADVINSVVDTSTNCYSLNFTNKVSYNNLLIQPGQTLTIDGNNGGFALKANPLGQVTTTNSISGANGTLLITGASAGGVFVATTNSSSGGVATYLDLSGLGTFIISNATSSSSATMQIGNGANRSDGVLFLAMTNYLALPGTGTGNSSALVVGDNTSNNGSSPGGTLNLGQTNTILADNIGIGLSKQSSATVRFNPAFTNNGANPYVYIRGFSTTAVKKWAIGDGLSQSGTSAAGTGTVDFRNGTVNALVTAMVLGRPSSVSVSTPNSAGTLSLSAGNISVVNLTNAMMTTVAGVGASPTNQTATGTINVLGTAAFSANNVVMAVLLGAGGSSTGTLNVTNGTLAIGTLTVGAGTSTLNVNGGAFILTNTAGATAAPLTALNLTSASLQLSVNGAADVTNIVATSVGTSGTTTITIASVAGVMNATTIPLISYSGTDPFASLTLTPLTGGFTGTLVDNSSNGRIDLQITPPAAGASLVWVGTTNSVLTSVWDTTTPDWLNANTLAPSAYADLDVLQFDDTASNNVVNLTTNVAPFSLLITNNALDYVFTGTGKISGIASLIKNGSGTLTLSESGGDSFNNGIIVSNGTLVLDNAGSGISGGLNIVSGTVQVGNNDANGNLPAGDITDNGALVFNRTDDVTVGTTIAGTGSVTKNNNDTLTLSVNNSFAGGLTANAGTMRPTAVGSLGTGPATVNSGGTLVMTAAATTNNIITLAGGTLGVASGGDYIMSTASHLTNAASTTSLVQTADPQNPSTTRNIYIDGTLHGSGEIVVINATNVTSPDSGQGFRLRGALNPGDFSGTITFSNNVKGEMQVTGAGPFSPAGTGTFRLVCGSYSGTNGTLCPPAGGYSEFNLRNNSTGNTVLGNDLIVAGTGTVILNPIGSAPTLSTITLGNLKVGGGQEVGVYLASTPNHVIVFPTVTLTGGDAKFSPKTPYFGSLTSVGSDLSLGDISEQTAGSGIIMAGWRTLYLTGVNTYSGNTTISNGTLALTGTASIANSPNILISGGATLDVSGLSSTFALGSGQTLTGVTATGTISGNVNMSSGALALNYSSGTPTLTETNGTLTMNDNAVTVTVSGSALTEGSYKLVSVGLGGSVAGSVSSSTVTINGAGAVHNGTLEIIGGELYLNVGHAPVIANIVTNSVTAGLPVKIALSGLASAAGWSDADGDTVSFSGVSPTSANGTNLTSDANYIYYQGTVTAEDHFNYTVTDGFLTATGTVYVEAVAATAPTISNPAVNSNGQPTFSGSGIPGYIYGVESATSLSGPWSEAGTVTADGTGAWSFTDVNQTRPTTIFYRLYYPDNPGNPPQ